MSDVVIYQVDGGVARVTFNRPERNNATTAEMRELYYQRLDQAAQDSDVRAIVVTGAGNSFCVGADTQALQNVDPEKVRSRPRERPATYPLTIPKPILCAINGPCAGLGLVHALACDIRFAAEGVKMTTAFVRRGLIAEYGSSWLLPRLIGVSRAFDLLVSGRVVKAEEALQLGLVNQVVPPHQLIERASAYAADLAENCSPTSMAVIKRQIYGDLDKGLEQAYAAALDEMLASLNRDDLKEGVASFLEKRPPSFPGFEALPR